jgi:hypothetical protein
MDYLASLFGRSSTSPLSQINSTPPAVASSPSKDLITGLPLPQSSERQTQPQARENKAPYVFMAGVVFTVLSGLITRRSIARRRVIPKPPLRVANGALPKPAAQDQVPEVSPVLEAFEALNVATINIFSLTTLAVGGGLWYLDIASMDEARTRLRGGLGIDGTGRTETEAEEDYEEWLATVLSRKEAKDRRREYEREKEFRRMNDRGRER